MSNSLATSWTDPPDVALDVKESTACKPLNLWRPSQFLAWQEPEGTHLLLPAYLSRRSLTTLIGPPGVGKSRLQLWLAICQILGREWCGMQTSPKPVKWLFLGDENSIGRWKDDLTHMFSCLGKGEIAKLEEYLRLPALESPEDGDIWLGDSHTQARLMATIEAEAPGAIVGDPLGNFAPEEVSKPGPMKEAVRLFLGLCRSAAPDAAITLLHHARTGRANIASGVGWDAGNYASGGKALLAMARCQMNLMPGSADDDTKLVLSCGKCNNAERFQTRGLLFDKNTFTYSVNSDFDVEAWRADVEGRKKSGQSLCNVHDVTSAVRDGYTTTKDLVEHLMEACATPKRTVERVIRKAVQNEAIKSVCRGNFALARKSGSYLKTST